MSECGFRRIDSITFQAMRIVFNQYYAVLSRQKIAKAGCASRVMLSSRLMEAINGCSKIIIPYLAIPLFYRARSIAKAR